MQGRKKLITSTSDVPIRKEKCIKKLTQRAFQEYLACEIWGYRIEIVKKGKPTHIDKFFSRGKKQAIETL